MIQPQAKHAVEKEEISLIVLTRDLDEELFHRLLGQVLRRVRDFAAKYDTDGIPKVVARAVEWDFAQDKENQEYFLVVALCGLEVIGHLLCHAVNYYGKQAIQIQQLEIDKGYGITLEQERRAFQQVIAWGKARGVTEFRAAAPSPAHVRRLRMLYGFESYLTTMKLTVRKAG